MIKLIIFDLSNVCFTIEEPPYLEGFIVRHHLPKEEFLSLYQSLLEKAECNEITGEDLWNTLLSKYRIKENPQKIVREMMDLKLPHTDVLELVGKLKEKYTVVYLTNYNKFYWDEIKRRFDLSRYFTDGVVSYEIGFRKPAKEGFEYILKKSNVKPGEVVFIDDSKNNIDRAAELEIKTHKFISLSGLKNFLSRESLL